MKMKPLFTAMALAGAAVAAHAGPTIDFSGYMRAGTGVNTRGGTQVCYGLGGAETKWRLGNECDYVVEPNINAKLAEFEGSDWHVHVMPSVYKAWDSGQTSPDTLTTRFGQIYTYGDHVSALANGKIWAGRRFYNRVQLGINDHFLENMDGNGAGVEDMDLGGAKMSVAFMMDPNNPANDNTYALPIRFTGIKDMPNGELSFYITPDAQLKSTDQLTAVDPAERKKGLKVSAYQTLNGMILGGNSLFGLTFEKRGDYKKTRLAYQQTANFGATAFDFITEFHKVTNTGSTGDKWFSIGARADTYIGGPFRFLVEAGHDQVKPDSGDKRNLTKVTLALAASAGKEAGSRPTVRFFLTHAAWNDAATATLNSNTQQVFGDKKAGTSIGIQGETWW